jgi:Fur family transcriptional regulator, ferric uptake regulator
LTELHLLLERLQRDGVRVTRQRRAILSAFCRSADALTPQRILDEGRRECPDLGLATVYRAVELLERDGILRRVHEPGGGESLALSLSSHGHHVLCTGCGRVAEFSTCELRSTIEGAKKETGFVINQHYLELLGLCENCAMSDREEQT